MTDLVQLALSLCATAGTAAEVVKKHIFHGHPLDRDRLTALHDATLARIAELEAENERLRADVTPEGQP